VLPTPSVSLPLDLATIAARVPLPWSHYVRLLSVESTQARSFYESEAIRGGWTVRQLERQIGSKFYERTLLSRNKAAMLRKGSAPRPEDVVSVEEEVKDPFVLEGRRIDLRSCFSQGRHVQTRSSQRFAFSGA
jgi:predicted nuclease of restriction endonuclease-like (RecB) superfamily